MGQAFSRRVYRHLTHTALPDNTNPLGPALVSAAAIRDPQRLALKCTVNGQVLQDGTTA